MISVFRATTMAAALCALSGAALAAPVALDFDALGQAAIAANAPVALKSAGGFSFQGAYVYAAAMLNPELDPIPAPDNASGFVMNVNRNGVGEDLVISVEQPEVAVANAGAPAAVAAPGANNLLGSAFQSMSFRWFSGPTPSGRAPTLTYTTASGAQGTFDLISGTTDLLWTFGNGPLVFPQFDVVTSVRFSAEGTAFGLDDMSIEVYATGGGNVPEPGSYALVGIALLAAGSASRRRS